MERGLRHSQAIAVLLGSAMMLAGCAADARVGRLERRVDSLAVTLTALLKEREAARTPAVRESVTVTLEGAAMAGDAHALVAIVEFTDYQCPFCERHFQNTLPELWRDYVRTGKVRYIIRDAPLTQLHPHALAAAKAARCAAAQSSSDFWRYHDALFGDQASITDTIFLALAKKLNLNVPVFRKCLASPLTASLVQKDLVEAGRLHLSGTPAFVVGIPGPGTQFNGTFFQGAYPYEFFRQVIDSALQVAARMSTSPSAR